MGVGAEAKSDGPPGGAHKAAGGDPPPPLSLSHARASSSSTRSPSSQVYKTIENKVDAILEAARTKKADLLGRASSDPKCVPRLKRPWHGPSVVMADSTWMTPFYAGVAQALLERGVTTAGWTPFGGAGGGAVTAVSFDLTRRVEVGGARKTFSLSLSAHALSLLALSHSPLSLSHSLSLSLSLSLNLSLHLRS